MNLTAARELRVNGKHAEARDLLVALVIQNPNDAELQYETACVHDFLGEEASAIAYYRAALLGRLSLEHLRGAYLGLGSTYRTLGQYTEAQATLRQGLERFPEANEMKVFLAMTLYNLGQSKAAIECLLTVLAQTSSDNDIQAYRRAILFYAEDIERIWPPDA
jgi:tetratricopeptide (TPR) repeat protein